MPNTLSDWLAYIEQQHPKTIALGLERVRSVAQQIGRAEALKSIGQLRKKEDAARLLVRVCCAIGSADGDFDESERAACRTICNELGLNPGDFDL